MLMRAAWLVLAVLLAAGCGSSALPAVPQPPPGPPPPVGQPVRALRALLLSVDFPDAPATASAASEFDRVVPTLRAYFREVSFGLFDLVVEPSPRWWRMPQPSAAYGLGSRQDLEGGKVDLLLRDAVAAADPEVDFRPYNAVLLVAPAGARIYCCFAHRSLSPPVTDEGARVEWVTFQKAEQTSIGVYAHEVGHVLGLPDLYDYALASAGYGIEAAIHVGPWDLMSRGPVAATRAHPSSWSKMRLGWLRAEWVLSVPRGGSGVAVLDALSAPPGSGGYAAAWLPVTGSRSYFVEVRSQEGFDGVLYDRGVLVYVYDATIPNGQGPLRLVDAHPEAQDPGLLRQYGPKYSAPFDLGPGEVSEFRDERDSVRVRVVGGGGRRYQVHLQNGGL